jgi:hypothetical protein
VSGDGFSPWLSVRPWGPTRGKARSSRRLCGASTAGGMPCRHRDFSPESHTHGAPPWTYLSIGIEAPSTGHGLSLGHTEEVRTVTKPTRWPEPRQFLVGLHGALLNRRSPWPTPVAAPLPVRNPSVELAMNRRVFLPCSVGVGHRGAAVGQLQRARRRNGAVPPRTVTVGRKGSLDC